jgi:hypothetical protein
MEQEIVKAESKVGYEPPRLTVISLRPEEAVLGHCKATTTGGPGASGSCFPFCGSSIGS